MTTLLPFRLSISLKRPSLTCNGIYTHSHITPPQVPPFLPYKYTKDEDHPGNSTIFGRGSVDAKGSVATQIIAINELIASSAISPDDVSLLYVVGEEIGGGGMRAANNLSLSHTQTIIFGEPTALHLVSGHKGTMQAIIRAKGKAGHSGYPWLGRSANEVLVSSLAAIMHLGDRLPTSTKYGSTTFNLGTLQGGVAANVIAQNATATIAVRIAHGTTAMIQHAMTQAVHEAVQPFLSGNDDDDDNHHLTPQDIVELDFTGAGYGPVDIDHDVPGFDVISVNYGTDIPWLEKVVPDQKRYLYGPGTIFVAHGDQEELREKDLWEAVEGYQKIVLFALGKEGERGSGEEKEDL